MAHPYKREDIKKYYDPKPSNHSREYIEKLVESIIDTTGYKYGQDLEEFVDSLGGRINHVDNSNELNTESGSILVHKKQDFDIYITKSSNYLRDRFTIAHELGHYILHFLLSDKKPLIAKRYGNDPVEYEANYFAAALLMPGNDVEEIYNKYDQDEGIAASIFSVSTSAMIVRLRFLGLKTWPKNPVQDYIYF